MGPNTGGNHFETHVIHTGEIHLGADAEQAVEFVQGLLGPDFFTYTPEMEDGVTIVPKGSNVLDGAKPVDPPIQ